MHLPINIYDLLNTNIVESDRMEFKSGWNPEAVLRSICAFANDFNNLGGGYILIGIEEQNGRALLPPKGINIEEADFIQKELVKICSYLKPIYTPILSLENYREKYILVIWVPGGQTRPYRAPATLGKNKEYKFYIRKASTTVAARNGELKELLELTSIPFDDRVNHHASLENIKLPLIQSFLNEVNSELLKESRNICFADLCRQMGIVDGGNEYLKPRNVGLLFFSDQPEKFFPYAQIDVVYFPDGEAGNYIQEEIFKGPIDHQLRSALRYIRNNFVTERVVKISDQAEARRFFNYPFPAIEEALVNAVYHRGYNIREPIEVRINRECIRVVSHPGVDHSVPLADVKRGEIQSKRYRNRRIGEFLKELDLAEGRGTGIPIMKHVLKANGSPEPIFVTDKSRLSFYTEIKIHPEFLKPLSSSINEGVHDVVYDGVHEPVPIYLTKTEQRILSIINAHVVGMAQILIDFNYKTITRNVRSAMNKLLTQGMVAYTIPDKPRSKRQQYKITPFGKKFLIHERAE